ncbi:SH3 domain-containing protein [Streptomyces sp. NPDC096012]|uniref:SH3 domain-containing protein n=1 Tax=Streptomyces sp. NPDC096012 TaxID=3155684 RepID=UPI00336A2D14
MPRFPSFRRSVATPATLAVATAAVLLATAPTAGARTAPAAQAGRYYHTWATDVSVRVSEADPNTCGRHPSVANCPDVREHLQPSTQFYVYCQGPGQTVGGNPYWLMINSGTTTGWMASYYVAYPDNRLPDVPDCPGMSGVGGAGAQAAARSARALGPYSVTAYETVNIRSAPNTSSRAFDKIRAGETRSDALCWTHGETVRDHGYTNDVWIGFTEGWASAVYLKGNEYAGLPADAKC